MSQIAYQQNAGEVKALEKYSIDWAIVGWGLLKEVGDEVGRSHGDENVFAKQVKEMCEQDLWREMARGAGTEVVEEEWGRLRVIADAVE